MCTGRASRLQGLHELLAAGVDRVGAPLTREPLADLRAGPWSLDELEPVATRSGTLHLAREDLHGVARRKRRVERDESSVDPRADAAVPHLGVDRVGEVDGLRPGGKGDHLALRREDEDLVLLQVDLQARHELGRVARSPAASRPGAAATRGPRPGCAAPCSPSARRRRTPPCRCISRGPDLELDRLALRADDRRVQRLVEVELGHRDVVLEPPLNRPPQRVDRTERAVAVLDRLDDHAHSDEIMDLRELLAPHDHLLVDRPVVLRAATHLGVDVQVGEALR